MYLTKDSADFTLNNHKPLSMEQNMEIPVIMGQSLNEGNIPVIVGSMPLKYMLDRYTIPYLDPLRPQEGGYQRKPGGARIKSFAKDLRSKKTDVPTSILMNIREEDITSYLKEKNGIYYLSIPLDSNIKFYIVDGQHRILAFKILYEEGFSRWGDQKIQFVSMLGASKDQEMKQFYTVNSTAKSVRTDLAYDLLTKMSVTDPKLRASMIKKGSMWKIDGQAIAVQMNKSSKIWKDKVRLANADKNETILPSASLVNSLKPLNTNSVIFKTADFDSKLKFLEAYWLAIKEICPEPFGDDSQSYSLMKGLGVSVLHELLVSVLELLKYEGSDITAKQSYIELMSPVLLEISDVNGNGETVEGSNFWLTATHGGAAGAYSSSAGKRVLLSKLDSRLPKLSY